MKSASLGWPIFAEIQGNELEYNLGAFFGT
jgi:hypothetical protein